MHPGNKRFLDAGCGNGRLIPRFEPYFHEIVAVEPDEQRYRQAIEFIRSCSLEDKTRIHQLSLQEYQNISDNHADFILCSHVIQHIHSYAVHPFLSGLAGLLSEHGLLAITTCHSIRPSNYFMKSFLKNGITTCEEVQEEEFNQLISGEGILPVQFFNYEIIAEYLVSIGLKVIDFRVFHIEDHDRLFVKDENHDVYFNAAIDRQKKYGRDMLILLQKT